MEKYLINSAYKLCCRVDDRMPQSGEMVSKGSFHELLGTLRKVNMFTFCVMTVFSIYVVNIDPFFGIAQHINERGLVLPCAKNPPLTTP